MNRFLTSATAMALGLALCGLANADGRNGQRIDRERFERGRNAECGRDDLRYFDRWRLQLDRDELRYFDDWRLDFAPEDLRYYENWQINHYCFHHGYR